MCVYLFNTTIYDKPMEKINGKKCQFWHFFYIYYIFSHKYHIFAKAYQFYITAEILQIVKYQKSYKKYIRIYQFCKEWYGFIYHFTDR